MTTFRDFKTAVFPSLWEHKEPEISYVEDKCSLHRIEPDGMTITKDGDMAYVVELYGKDYSGLDESTMMNLFNTRRNFFNELPSRITVSHHSHRIKQTLTFDRGQFSNPYAAEIGKKWYDWFDTTFRTKHYLMFTISYESTLDRIRKGAQKIVKKSRDEDKQTLIDCVDLCLNRMSAYEPTLLQGDDLASYWGWLLSGYPIKQKWPENDGVITGLLSRSTLQWPSFKDYQIYQTADRKIFSSWLYIKLPANVSNEEFFNELFSVQQKFSIYQTFTRLEKGKAHSNLKERQRNIQGYMEDAEHHELEVASAKAELQADNLNFMYHRFSIEVLADTLEDLRNAVLDISKVASGAMYALAKERVNCEPSFWSRFPGMMDYQERVRELSTDNAAHFATFPSMGEGLSHCGFGPSAVTHFKTLSGSEFGFTFQESPKYAALANTVLSGGSESGKTTLMAYLEAMCGRFENFKIVNLDQLHGLEVFTRYMGGDYMSFEDIKNMNLNPLLLPDNTENRKYLEQWFQILLGIEKADEQSKTVISRVVRMAYDLPKEHRNLEQLALAFGGRDESRASEAIKKWLPGGPLGDFFSSNSDSLDFSSNIVTFDMTHFLDDPDVLPAFASYMFYRIMLVASEPNSSGIIFVDELDRYLSNSIMGPQIALYLQQIRKKGWMIATACQDVPTILNNQFKDKFKLNVATWIIYPDSKADHDYYVGELGLNETEFKWVQETDPMARKILVKRLGGESVRLDIDLSGLGSLIKAFDSSTRGIEACKLARGKYGEKWRSHYIAGC
jgi:type IV secretion system protein VirB4